MKILLINPNTSHFVTERAVAAAQKISSSTTVIEGVSGEFGVPIINSETDMVIGAHSTIDLAAKYASEYDAIGLAISFDIGLRAAREMLAIPVAGLAESAIRGALEVGERIALLSFGARTKMLYENLAKQYTEERNIAGVYCMESLSMEELQSENALKHRIEVEVAQVVHKFGCDVVVLLATAFAGLSQKISLKVPVVDCVEEMIRLLEASATDQTIADSLRDSNWPERKTTIGISTKLSECYRTFPELNS